MKKKNMIRALVLMLVVCLLLPGVVACSPELEENEIEVKWHRGFVGSEHHTTDALKLVDKADGYSYTDVITIPEKGTRITFTDCNTEDMVDTEYATKEIFVVSHWVEQDGEWVLDHPGDNYTGTGGRSGEIAKWNKDDVIYSYITSYDNESIRLCYRSGQTKTNKFKIEFPRVYAEKTFKQGTLLSSETNILKDLQVQRFLKTAKDDCWFEELEGITMYAMGDSYFGGSKNGKEYVWPNLMAQKYAMEFSNWGIGGSSVCNRGYKPMCNRISDMSSGAPDIILLEGGRNDFNGSFELGDVNSTDPSTFCGGINSCIDQLQAKYPNALIIGITCWAYNATNKNGDKQEDFGNAMMEVCAARGIPCFNAMDKTNTRVDMDSLAFRKTYSQDEGDVSHLNTAGMILVEPAFEKFIAEQYKIFLAKKKNKTTPARGGCGCFPNRSSLSGLLGLGLFFSLGLLSRCLGGLFLVNDKEVVVQLVLVDLVKVEIHILDLVLTVGIAEFEEIAAQTVDHVCEGTACRDHGKGDGNDFPVIGVFFLHGKIPPLLVWP